MLMLLLLRTRRRDANWFMFLCINARGTARALLTRQRRPLNGGTGIMTIRHTHTLVGILPQPSCVHILQTRVEPRAAMHFSSPSGSSEFVCPYILYMCCLDRADVYVRLTGCNGMCARAIDRPGTAYIKCGVPKAYVIHSYCYIHTSALPTYTNDGRNGSPAQSMRCWCWVWGYDANDIHIDVYRTCDANRLTTAMRLLWVFT